MGNMTGTSACANICGMNHFESIPTERSYQGGLQEPVMD
jgi:hypothetical protein